MEDISIIEQLAYSTIRIYVEYRDGKLGTGTGFCFALREYNSSKVPVIITNKHVVENAKKGSFRLTLQDTNGYPSQNHEDIYFEDFENFWFKHPNPNIDLCFMPIAPIIHRFKEYDKYVFYRFLSKQDLISTEDINQLLGMDQVTMVGYPNGIWDEVNNYPVFRRGVTASHPKNNWNGESVFLVDLACFPGSSGSPVLLTDFGMVIEKNGNINLGQTRIKLLGILYAGPQYTAEGEIEIRDVPVANVPVVKTSIPNNLGIVIKSHKILELEELLPENIT